MSFHALRIDLEPLTIGSRALALAMQCWPEAERAAQLESLRLLTLTDGSGFLLLSAWRAENLVGSILAQQIAGKAATLWPPQLADGEADSSIAGQLLSAVEQELIAGGIHLCQALLSKGQDHAFAALAAAGYQHPADLLYMTCESQQFPKLPPEFPGFLLRPFQPGNEAELAQLIDETYISTQDCPSLNGLRSTLDVVYGYQHVGEFRPDRWLILESSTTDSAPRPSGCLLLSRHFPHRTMELIYVGVTPTFRQQGLGRKLTQHAQWLSAQDECERLVLAVDAANGPAIAMYSAAGFWAWEERAIWVKDLSRKESDEDHGLT
ncbi:MAG: GNAT family N-acetyltransferase [Planctomycetales bacterium]|nr:GNAT family N-acetyltransferase [Planctomycetales bacterium]